MSAEGSLSPFSHRLEAKKKKKVRMKLVGQDGNAFSLIGAFVRAARKEGWTSDEIREVVDEATSGDYDHLLAVLASRCQSGGFK